MYHDNDNTKVVIIAHSLGNRVTHYFCRFMEKKCGRDWASKYLDNWLAIGPLWCMYQIILPFFFIFINMIFLFLKWEHLNYLEQLYDLFLVLCFLCFVSNVYISYRLLVIEWV